MRVGWRPAAVSTRAAGCCSDQPVRGDSPAPRLLHVGPDMTESTHETEIRFQPPSDKGKRWPPNTSLRPGLQTDPNHLFGFCEPSDGPGLVGRPALPGARAGLLRVPLGAERPVVFWTW